MLKKFHERERRYIYTLASDEEQFVSYGLGEQHILNVTKKCQNSNVKFHS